MAGETTVEGKVLFKDQDIFNMDTIELGKKGAMVFQKPNPFPMNIYDNIAYGPRMQGIKKNLS